MATCVPCADADHVVCMFENEDKTTDCPGCCQHRETVQVIGPDGKTYSAPPGVTRVDVR